MWMYTTVQPVKALPYGVVGEAFAAGVSALLSAAKDK
jgi:hypothetical protein